MHLPNHRYWSGLLVAPRSCHQGCYQHSRDDRWMEHLCTGVRMSREWGVVGKVLHPSLQRSSSFRGVFKNIHARWWVKCMAFLNQLLKCHYVQSFSAEWDMERTFLSSYWGRDTFENSEKSWNRGTMSKGRRLKEISLMFLWSQKRSTC